MRVRRPALMRKLDYLHLAQLRDQQGAHQHQANRQQERRRSGRTMPSTQVVRPLKIPSPMNDISRYSQNERTVGDTLSRTRAVRCPHAQRQRDRLLKGALRRQATHSGSPAVPALPPPQG